MWALFPNLMAEVCDLMRMVGWHYVRYITSISLPSNSLVLQFPTCRKPWFSLRNFVMSSPPLGSPVTYWMTGWLECVQRPYSLPFLGAVFFFGLSISRLICFSSPLWIVTVTLIFAAKGGIALKYKKRRTSFTAKAKYLTILYQLSRTVM